MVTVFMVVAAVAMPACAEPEAGRFVANADSTVTDTSTGLMWAAKDNGSKLNLENAKSYCEDYSGGGYTDWRMPTLDELSGLYDHKEKSVKGESFYSNLIYTITSLRYTEKEAKKIWSDLLFHKYEMT